MATGYKMARYPTVDGKVSRFLFESNAIEDVWGGRALVDSERAWEFIIQREKLIASSVMVMHRYVMASQGLPEEELGQFRRVQVVVGGHEGPPWQDLLRLMQEWVANANTDKTEEDIKRRHIEYEMIHPFTDGNGRTGRILMNWQRQRAGLPILVIEERNKQDYYQWFRT